MKSPDAGTTMTLDAAIRTIFGGMNGNISIRLSMSIGAAAARS